MERRLLSARNLALAFGVSALGLVACNKNDNDGNIGNDQVAGLMAFNLSTDQPAVGFTLGGNYLTNAPLAFNSFTGAYLPIYPGNRTVESFVFNTSSVLASTPGTFDVQKYYSTFLVGANNNYRNVVVKDNFDSLSASSGKAYIRYINAIPDSTGPAVVVTANGSDAINETASFAAVSEFKEVTPGSVSISINNGGTINKNRTVTLAEKKVYTALLIGKPGSTNADSIQIRYVENGTLTDEDAAAQQRVSSQRAASGN